MTIAVDMGRKATKTKTKTIWLGHTVNTGLYSGRAQDQYISL